MGGLEGADPGGLAAEPAPLGPLPSSASSRSSFASTAPPASSRGILCPPGGLAQASPAGSASQPTAAVGEALGPVCPISTGVAVRPATPRACVRAEWAGVGELVGTLPRVYSGCSLNGSSGEGR